MCINDQVYADRIWYIHILNMCVCVCVRVNVYLNLNPVWFIVNFMFSLLSLVIYLHNSVAAFVSGALGCAVVADGIDG